MELFEKVYLKVLLENNVELLLEPDNKTLVKENEFEIIFSNTEPNIRSVLEIKKLDNVYVGKLNFEVESPEFREKNNLSALKPLKITVSLDEKPNRMLANYLHRDWWTRPSFFEKFQNIPKRTQSLLLENTNNYTYILPLIGDKYKTEIESGTIENGDITFVLTGYTAGVSAINDISFIISNDDSPYSAINKAFKLACKIKNIPTKLEKDYIEMFEYLGWCSWDAFYSEVSEELLRAKVKELKEKSVPVKWILIDDGWLNQDKQKLQSFSPDKTKFPNEFKSLIEDIKKDIEARWVGVWHAFGGYWGGIMPESDIATNNLYRTHSGQLLPHYNPEIGYKFWDDFYSYLANEGIDFVKVDGQSALKNYYGNNQIIGEVAKGAHFSLEKAVLKHFDGNIINCMGMASENMFNRKTAVSRNSDDFVPEDKNGFIEHLMQNVYNSLYHDELYYGDWDMFWTNHQDANKHAVLRAISGGPIYFSDKLDITEINTIMPLIYNDGRILRMDRGAKPSNDCIFNNPEITNYVKITNVSKDNGYILAYNFLEDCDIEISVSSKDIYDLKGDVKNYLVYDFLNDSSIVVGKDEMFNIKIKANSFVWLQFAPINNALTAIGLTNKYISSHPIKSINFENDVVFVKLAEGGDFKFFSENKINKIIADGTVVTNKLSNDGSIYTLDIKEFLKEVKIEIYL